MVKKNIFKKKKIIIRISLQLTSFISRTFY